MQVTCGFFFLIYLKAGPVNICLVLSLVPQCCFWCNSFVHPSSQVIIALLVAHCHKYLRPNSHAELSNYLPFPNIPQGEAVFARCLSSLKDERVQASKVLDGPKMTQFSGNKKAFLEDIRKVSHCACQRAAWKLPIKAGFGCCKPWWGASESTLPDNWFLLSTVSLCSGVHSVIINWGAEIIILAQELTFLPFNIAVSVLGIVALDLSLLRPNFPTIMLFCFSNSWNVAAVLNPGEIWTK